MSSDIPILSTTNSRLRGGLNQRKNLGRTGENVLGGTGNFDNNVKQFGANDLNSTQSSNGYVPRQRGTLAGFNNNNQNFSNNIESKNNLNSYNPNNDNFGLNLNRKPLISEQQIDSHTSKIEKEIQNLDFKLSGNKNLGQNAQSVKNVSQNNNINKNQNVFNLEDDDNLNNYGKKTSNGFEGYSTQNQKFNQQSSNNNLGYQSYNNINNQQKQELNQNQNQQQSNGFVSYNTQQSDTQNSFNPQSSKNKFNQQNKKQEKKIGTEMALDIFEQKEKELKEQIQRIEKQKQQDEKVQEIKEKASQQKFFQQQQQQEGDLKLKLQLSSPVVNKKIGGSIIENQKRQLFQQKNFNSQKNVNNNINNNLNSNNNNFKPMMGGFGKSSNYNNNNNLQNDVLEDSTDYLNNGYMMTKTQNQQQNNNIKKPIKDIDNEIAVATGVNEALFEESQQLDDIQLITCPEGCGRQFTEQALQKHVGVCKKLFQKKNNEKSVKNNLDKNKQQIKSNSKTKEKSKNEKSGKKPNLQEYKKILKQQKAELEQNGQLDMQFV